MQHILYTSRATPDFDSGEVFRIIETSARNNPTRGVTGFLAFAHDSFVQLVEGPAGALDDLLEELHGDPRHQGLVILERNTIVGRSFPNWRMERLAVRGEDCSALMSYLAKAGISRTAAERVRGIFTPRVRA